MEKISRYASAPGKRPGRIDVRGGRRNGEGWGCRRRRQPANAEAKKKECPHPLGGMRASEEGRAHRPAGRRYELVAGADRRRNGVPGHSDGQTPPGG
jgi:hypothetical protein